MDTSMIQKKLAESDLEAHSAIIRQREAAISSIAQAVTEVNEIMRDLSSLVSTQQVAIDEIEANIQESAACAKQGLVELKNASEYQKPKCTML